MQRYIFRIVLALAIVTAILAAALYRDQVSVDRLDAWVASPWSMGPFAFVALYAAGTVIFMPGLVFALAAVRCSGRCGAACSISSAQRSGRASPS